MLARYIKPIKNCSPEKLERYILDTGPKLIWDGHRDKPFIDAPWDQDTPLGIAVIENNLDIVRILLKYGANPNEWTYRCYPLTWAAGVEMNFSITELLLQYGADTERIDSSGMFPLRMVCVKDPKVTKLLCQYGADIGSYSWNNTPMGAVTSAEYVEGYLILRWYWWKRWNDFFVLV